jgi:outer membrane protein assembly factor BamE (lipoprotein component of BamABCDE complex)
MKKLTALAISLLVIVGLFVVLESLSPTESSMDEVILLVSGDTEYAEDFTEEAFARIQLGDTESHVRELLGEPIRSDSYDDGSSYLWYSRSPSSTHYRQRHFQIKNGLVAEIIADLYFD